MSGAKQISVTVDALSVDVWIVKTGKLTYRAYADFRGRHIEATGTSESGTVAAWQGKARLTMRQTSRKNAPGRTVVAPIRVRPHGLYQELRSIATRNNIVQLEHSIESKTYYFLSAQISRINLGMMFEFYQTSQ